MLNAGWLLLLLLLPQELIIQTRRRAERRVLLFSRQTLPAHICQNSKCRLVAVATARAFNCPYTCRPSKRPVAIMTIAMHLFVTSFEIMIITITICTYCRRVHYRMLLNLSYVEHGQLHRAAVDFVRHGIVGDELYGGMTTAVNMTTQNAPNRVCIILIDHQTRM
jgi:hypothetical protein